MFGGGEAGGDFAQAGGSDSDVFDEAVVCAGEGGDRYLGDGLCVACAYFADVGFVTFKVT